MKHTKFLTIASLFIVLLTSGCAKKAKSEPTLNKDQVLKVAQKSFKSGRATQVLNLRTDTSQQLITSSYTFGGDPTVFHLNYQTKIAQDTRGLEAWISNTNMIYINGQSTWYKDNLNHSTGHSYADLLSAVLNNQVLTNPSNKLVKQYNLKKNGSTYTLSAKTTDQAIMKKAADPIFATSAQGVKQEKLYRKLQKYSKYRKMTVKLVVKKRKLTNFKYTINMRINKLNTMQISQSYDNFGQNDFLKIPTNILNAKPLPQNKQTTKKTKQKSKKHNKKVIAKTNKTTKKQTKK